MNEDTQKLEACARAAHEVNRAYCFALGDTSQPSWEDAPEWQRSSATNGVRGVLDGNGPEAFHESWLKEKAEAGWKYGPTKNPEAKEHPCFVPYAELPLEQSRKDELFVGTVRSVAAALQMTVTYPASPARGVMPALAQRTIDWSKEKTVV